MTPADLERVRVALTEHFNGWPKSLSRGLWGWQCGCGKLTGSHQGIQFEWQAWELGIDHIIAVLAAQEEETE